MDRALQLRLDRRGTILCVHLRCGGSVAERPNVQGMDGALHA